MNALVQKRIDAKTFTAYNNGDFFHVLLKSDVEEIFNISIESQEPTDELLDCISNLIWNASIGLDRANIQRIIDVEDLAQLCKDIANLLTKKTE